MQFFKRSIQWQLILSMGAALLASLLIVILVYASAVERLAERYLLDEALPANINAIRNDIERTLAAHHRHRRYRRQHAGARLADPG